ncbi:nucleoside triphosphate pyrophosphohydrolase [Oceanicoccus sagamiensis]|uniref:Nucleoside triphosphate pyrophosphohydrolase n=2 Tax=Oceanicoccus sagamiensis TaxID=716816 RepID=A0A1X9NEI1_9GAMM|nr:nucleoside triphosphate pyrophosphohydrolase [Oceanicoccus sagamiensis]
MSRLRDPEDGCPWDRVQDFSTIVPHTIEESYELADAIEQGDMQHIREELGDVLFQVVFYSQLGKEQERFDFASVTSDLVAKLVRRHPHVFPEGTLSSRVGEQTKDTEAIKQTWEAIKSTERAGKQQQSVLDDVPAAFPALIRATKLQKRAAQTGFDWEHIDGALAKLKEEVDELIEAREQQSQQQIEAELGDVLFSVVNLSRYLNVDAESSLRATNKKFENRFKYIERVLERRGVTPEQSSLAEMDALWDEAKKKGI